MVHAGKGNKDRVPLVPSSVVEALRQQLEQGKKLYERDLEYGQGGHHSLTC